MKKRMFLKNAYIIRRPIVVSSHNVEKSITLPLKTIIPIADQLKAARYMASSPTNIDRDDDRQQEPNLNPVAVKT